MSWTSQASLLLTIGWTTRAVLRMCLRNRKERAHGLHMCNSNSSYPRHAVSEGAHVSVLGGALKGGQGGMKNLFMKRTYSLNRFILRSRERLGEGRMTRGSRTGGIGALLWKREMLGLGGDIEGGEWGSPSGGDVVVDIGGGGKQFLIFARTKSITHSTTRQSLLRTQEL